MAILLDMVSGAARLETNDIHLPFHLHSAGHTVFSQKEEIHTQGMFCDFVEFGWCTEGRGIFQIFDKPCQIEKNDVYYYLPGEDHVMKALTDNFTIYWFALTGSLATPVMLSYHYKRVQHASEDCPVALFNEITKGIKISNPVATSELCAHVLSILARANSYKSEMLHTNRKISQIMEIVRNSLGNPALCVDYVAMAMKIPKTTLREFFERETGKNLGEYIRNERFQKALVLIRNTDMPITEVAKTVGYTEMPSFCRLIKRGIGMTPLEYKNK